MQWCTYSIRHMHTRSKGTTQTYHLWDRYLHIINQIRLLCGCSCPHTFKLGTSTIRKVQVFGTTDIQRGKNNFIWRYIKKTDLSNNEQLPTTKVFLLYSSIIRVNRSIYVIVNVLYYRFPYSVLSRYICAPPPL